MEERVANLGSEDVEEIDDEEVIHALSFMKNNSPGEYNK